MPESGSFACEEFFTSDLRQTLKTATYQHLASQWERGPLLSWGGLLHHHTGNLSSGKHGGEHMGVQREVPSQIKQQLRNWQICFWTWNLLHYVLGLGAAIGAAYVAALKADAPGWVAPAVAIATAALTFLKASTKANAYISAWRELNAARIRFELNDTLTPAMLAEANERGEQMIGKAD